MNVRNECTYKAGTGYDQCKKKECTYKAGTGYDECKKKE